MLSPRAPFPSSNKLFRSSALRSFLKEASPVRGATRRRSTSPSRTLQPRPFPACQSSSRRHGGVRRQGLSILVYRKSSSQLDCGCARRPPKTRWFVHPQFPSLFQCDCSPQFRSITSCRHTILICFHILFIGSLKRSNITPCFRLARTQ